MYVVREDPPLSSHALIIKVIEVLADVTIVTGRGADGILAAWIVATGL